MTRYLFPALLVAACLGAFLAGRGLRNAPQVLTRVQVDTVELYRDRPTAKPSLGQRIVWTDVTPRVIATTTTTDTGSLRRYCAATVAVSDPGDGEKRETPPAVLPDFRGRYDGTRLRLWSTLSDGRAFYQETAVSPPFQFLTADSSVTVRRHRSFFPRLTLRPFVGANAGLTGDVEPEVGVRLRRGEGQAVRAYARLQDGEVEVRVGGTVEF